MAWRALHAGLASPRCPASCHASKGLPFLIARGPPVSLPQPVTLARGGFGLSVPPRAGVGLPLLLMGQLGGAGRGSRLLFRGRRSPQPPKQARVRPFSEAAWGSWLSPSQTLSSPCHPAFCGRSDSPRLQMEKEAGRDYGLPGPPEAPLPKNHICHAACPGADGQGRWALQGARPWVPPHGRSPRPPAGCGESH